MGLIAVVGTLIALTQACIALAVYFSSLKRQRVDRGTQRIIRIHDWGNECIVALAEAGAFHLLQVDDFPDRGTYKIQKNNVLYRLSSLIDRGRLFYQNVGQDKYGQEKFPANRGFRPEILDPLVAAYRSVLSSDGSADQDSFQRLYRWRGRFISLLQYEVDPSWLQEARFYSDGPGTGAGISVNAQSEPPKWPEGRLPPKMKQKRTK